MRTMFGPDTTAAVGAEARSLNSAQHALRTFATAKLGVVLVPIDVMLGPDEIAYLLAHSGAGGMVAEDTLAPTAEQVRERHADLAR